MTISYGGAQHRSRKNTAQSGAIDRIKNLVEHFKAEEIDILSEGVVEVLRDKVAFAEYVERLSEGTSDTTQEDLAMLAENVRTEMLNESMISGANPITALSLPMLRIGYPKMAVREGLPTEPVEQPKFKVTTKKAFVVDPVTKDKLYMPSVWTKRPDLFGLPQLKADAIAVPTTGLQNYDLLAPIGKNAALGDEIDPNFAITSVKVDGKEYAVRFALDTNINVIAGEVTTTGGDTVKVFGSVDRRKGLLSVMAIGGVLEEVKVQGFISSEMNNASTQVGFDITAEEIVIGTGQPIESPINIQAMTDVMAMYQVDSTLVHMETMSTTLAQTTDLEGVRFIANTFTTLENKIVETFDVVPPANYALGDAAWREQIKIKFDRLVTKLQQEVNIYSGHAVIFAHPLDAQVVSNVKWMYAAGEQPNDVTVDYKVGTFASGVTEYYLLQSNHFQQGTFYVVYLPAEADFRTLTYFPYSFNVVRGAASPNNPNVPSIAMLKRYLFKAFTPMVGTVTIQNNG